MIKRPGVFHEMCQKKNTWHVLRNYQGNPISHDQRGVKKTRTKHQYTAMTTYLPYIIG